jgi:hypothetical protein
MGTAAGACGGIAVIDGDRKSGHGGATSTSTSSTNANSTVVGTPTNCPTPAHLCCPTEDSCYCDPNAAVEPEECAATQQFHCDSYEPQQLCCRCNQDAPLSQADCPQGYQFTCYGYDPPIDCVCVVAITPNP